MDSNAIIFLGRTERLVWKDVLGENIPHILNLTRESISMYGYISYGQIIVVLLLRVLEKERLYFIRTNVFSNGTSYRV